MPTEIRVKAKVAIPAVPSALTYYDGSEKIELADVEVDDLERIGEAWLDSLRARRQQQLDERWGVPQPKNTTR